MSSLTGSGHDYNQHHPDYIVADFRDGQNMNNFLGIKDLPSLVARLMSDQNYAVFYHQGDQYIFQKLDRTNDDEAKSAQ